MFKNEVEFIKKTFNVENEFLPLHPPVFDQREIELVTECIKSTFVSSVGEFVTEFENLVAEYCGMKKAVACVNGTNALHLALKLAGVGQGDRVITQPLTFIATANAIKYCNAEPVFVDVDLDTLGLSPEKLEDYLKKQNIGSKKIKAVVPMHTFGHPCRIAEIKSVCDKYDVKLVEDCAESLGSLYKGTHTGNWSEGASLSFNGNKTITTGGGGMLLFNDEKLADYAKHLTCQAKIPHKWEFRHSECGYNYRMPNINAALGVAQMEKLPRLIESQRNLAKKYENYFKDRFVKELAGSRSNYWLQAILLENRKERDAFLEYTNSHGVMTRPVWTLMNELDMFRNCEHGDLSNVKWLEERLVNIPSGAVLE